MKQKTKHLAIFGSASDVGKSITVTAMCRIFSNMGIKTAPFKAQNMSNNSFVTYNGDEIGVAQAAQANAAKILPTSDMNPILLKPTSSTGSQIILNGQVYGTTNAKEYYKNTDFLFNEAKKSLGKLSKNFELIIIEGAGSCAEVNLKDEDFANFKIAKTVNADIILVADIDKGGVFAQIIGTLAVLSKSEKKMIKGILINKFRGDKSLFDDGIRYIEQKTQIPVLGLIPYYEGLNIDYEDSLSIDKMVDKTEVDQSKINIAIIKLPHISNFTDFTAFDIEPDVRIHYLTKPLNTDIYDAIIIPGSKNVISDIDWLKKTQWDKQLKDFVSGGKYLMGICGGYQMLGKSIYDPYSIESNKKECKALGLLDIETTLTKHKSLYNIKGVWIDGNIDIEGYEIHMGKTRTSKQTQAINIQFRNGNNVNIPDGSINSDGHIFGCYIHGIFDDYRFRHYFLRKIAKNKLKSPIQKNMKDIKEKQYDTLAKHFFDNMDFKKLMDILGVRF